MKRRIALSIALALSVISLVLVSSGSTTRAQQRQRFGADTSMVTLGPNQVLRVTAAWDLDNDGQALVGFSRIEYVQGDCNDGVCKHAVSSIYAANPVALKPGEAASIAAAGDSITKGVRVVVESNRRDVRVIAEIIDTDTGRVVATFTAGQDARMDSL